ncbi:MAG: 4Fe-4S dicluster domain-containing protein [Firmicutes bacterium]|nr:4Fe-4S dicluster domain-containing protein [Bacillota bacterium]
MGRKFTVSIKSKWCKKCGICAAFCPRKVFTFKAGNVPEITSEEQCIGCNQCVDRCPDFAVTVRGKKNESDS